MRRRRIAAAVAVAGLMALGTVPAVQTLARWNEPVYGSGSFTALTLPTIGAIGCANQTPSLLPTSVALSWTPSIALPANAEYQVRVTRGTTTTTAYVTTANYQVSVNSVDLSIINSSGYATVAVRAVTRTSAGTVTWVGSSQSRQIYYTQPVAGLLFGGFTCTGP